MDLSTLPTQNYVGLLQQMCGKNKISCPDYHEDSQNVPSKMFKCICKLQQWTTEGLGCSKKIAKHNSAMEMLKILENEDLTDKTNNTDMNKNSAISKLYEYCSREKKENPPLFADKPNEDDLFVVTCTWKDFTSEGRGSSRKIAKEKAADLCAKHFKIHQYFDNLKKEEERQKSFKNSIQLLHEFCQSKKLNSAFGEEKIILSAKKEMYIATCKVGKHEARSAQNISKKNAKMEVATLMLKMLHGETPVSSPSTVDNLKRKLDDDSDCSDHDSDCSDHDSDCSDHDSDEPLLKRMK